MQMTFADRLGRSFTVDAPAGRRASVFLHQLHVPLDAVLVSVNGRYVDAAAYVFDPADAVIVEMVRAYHLPEFLAVLDLTDVEVIRSVRPTDGVVGEPDPDTVYLKRSLTFSDDGDVAIRAHQLDAAGVLAYVEDTFTDACAGLGLEEGETLVALSGGRDSLAMTYLLAAARSRGVRLAMRAVTVETIALPADLPVALEACRALAVDHALVRDAEVREQFGLTCDVASALGRVHEVMGQNASIAACHTMMRAAVEEHARRAGIGTVAFGLHNEDLLATLLRSLSSGIPFGESMVRKTWGSFTFCYPLWPMTKKELTLYLKLRAPEHSRQGAPSRFDRGGLNRDINYFLADSIQSLWPELSFHLFAGYERLVTAMRGVVQSFEQCARCGLTMVQDLHRVNDGRCTTCTDLETLDLVS